MSRLSSLEADTIIHSNRSPMPKITDNWHTAVVTDKSYEEYARTGVEDLDGFGGRGKQVLFGIRDDGNSEVKEIYYPKAEWNAANAERDAEDMFDLIGFYAAGRENPPGGVSVPKDAAEQANKALTWADELDATVLTGSGRERAQQIIEESNLPAADVEDTRSWFARHEGVRSSMNEDAVMADEARPTPALVNFWARGGVPMRGAIEQATSSPIPRLNPTEEVFQDPTLEGLEEHASIEDDRENPDSLDESDYPGVFEDFDEDEIPTADDPHPLTPGDTETIEEVSLAEEFQKIFQTRDEYDEARAEIASKLRNRYPTAKVKSRTKTPYSIINKWRRKRLEGPKGLTDVAGGMLIVEDFDRLQDVREWIESGALGPVQEIENHYQMAGPYRAVHYIIEVDDKPVELQLKTERQAALASAAHTPYKRGTVDETGMERIGELAHQADQGDVEAEKYVDPLLDKPDELEEKLTKRENGIVSGLFKLGVLATAVLGIRCMTSNDS